ncbi:hypothetical protein [Jannaschia sp. R86511]|uniref:hypothetical protein n=1 Tax=Jannaschia sp. R86511 TaxID=3093853 RepID=UPI0036D24541
MALPPYYVPRVPGLPQEGLGPVQVPPGERRLRRAGAVGLAVLGVLVAVGLLAVGLGLLREGILATALAAGFGAFLSGGLVVDLLAGLRRPRRAPQETPGLRPASFLYLAAALCMVAAFAFLAT